MLGGDRLVAEIHGAPQDLGHYVATVRDPNDFFKFEHYSLTTKAAEVKTKLSKLKRHNKVRLWGEIVDQPGPQKHLVLTRLAIEVPITGEIPPFERKAEFPETLPSEGTFFTALVHAIVRDKKILVVEFKMPFSRCAFQQTVKSPNSTKTTSSK